MEEKVWISQAPGMPMVEKTATYERGTYYFFDAHNWRKVRLNYSIYTNIVKLESVCLDALMLGLNWKIHFVLDTLFIEEGSGCRGSINEKYC